MAGIVVKRKQILDKKRVSAKFYGFENRNYCCPGPCFRVHRFVFSTETAHFAIETASVVVVVYCTIQILFGKVPVQKPYEF